jgi:hypothetical protein
MTDIMGKIKYLTAMTCDSDGRCTSKKGVKKSTFTEASTEKKKKKAFGCCESSWRSMPVPQIH